MTELAISNTLRRQRFLNGEITQAKLAEMVGITRQTIIALETERYAPSLELAMKLSAVFGCTVDELFSWKDPEQARDEYYYDGEKK